MFKLARIFRKLSSRFGQTVLADDEERPEGRVKSTLPRSYLKSDGQSGRTVYKKGGLGHRALIFLSGFLWLNVGVYLLTIGIYLVLSNATSSYTSTHFSLFSLFPQGDSPEQHSLIIIFSMLFLGYLKYRFVLRKTVEKQLHRIRSLPNPAPWKRLFGRKYYLLILTMIFLGISLRLLPIAAETRGGIDLIIGAALVSGALHYFRQTLIFYVQGSNIQ
ncbi:MAG: hypothetical protein K940chlam2_01369 [Chlamydiae bacterium]|nr:hypothetical protein [Chlamydiota bacterium]